MKSFTVRRVLGVGLHYPQPLAIVSDDPLVGELCRTQTEAKALQVQRALALLERYERGELIEREACLTLVASD